MAFRLARGRTDVPVSRSDVTAESGYPPGQLAAAWDELVGAGLLADAGHGDAYRLTEAGVRWHLAGP